MSGVDDSRRKRKLSRVTLFCTTSGFLDSALPDTLRSTNAPEQLAMASHEGGLRLSVIALRVLNDAYPDRDIWIGR